MYPFLSPSIPLPFPATDAPAFSSTTRLHSTAFSLLPAIFNRPPLPRLFLPIPEKWEIEGADGGEPIYCRPDDKKQTVYIYNCKNATIVIEGKCNMVAIDGCSKSQVVMEDVISGVEVSNSKSIKFQISGSCPSASIDKTDGCTVYLMSDPAKECKISTAKHSDVQISYMDGEDMKELPVPEQFVHVLDESGSLKSSVSELYSS
jgi:adenylyl cyclase-associated protein